MNVVSNLMFDFLFVCLLLLQFHNDEDEITFASNIFLFVTEFKISHLSLISTTFT